MSSPTHGSVAAGFHIASLNRCSKPDGTSSSTGRDGLLNTSSLYTARTRAMTSALVISIPAASSVGSDPAS
jgi:hypothetical protein